MLAGNLYKSFVLIGGTQGKSRHTLQMPENFIPPAHHELAVFVVSYIILNYVKNIFFVNILPTYRKRKSHLRIIMFI